MSIGTLLKETLFPGLNQRVSGIIITLALGFYIYIHIYMYCMKDTP